MKIKVESFTKALQGIETDRQLSKEIVEDALKEAMAKAYRKQIELPDAYVRVDIIKNQIHIYQQRVVVEEVEDDELEISLEDALAENPKAELGDMIDEEVEFKDFDRAAVVLAKSVMKQKIREAEKMQIYEEYCDKVDEMVLGTVETVEEKFLLVNIGKTLAMMKKSAQIPTEHYYEGQKLSVVITEVNKETKGAQVLVSRATPVFVRRLFEKEVPEIYNGIIEIKAIAREAGERCKIAVVSHNENIDPIGACIGPKGSRVLTIINELHGEKIDIFEWSDNIATLIANALSPTEGVVVLPNENVKDGLMVVVPDDQLSLAIGKRGKNARLAVKLSNHKIDIKSQSEMAELGIDYLPLAQKMQEEYEERKAAERAYKQQERIKELNAEQAELEEVTADFDFEEELEEAEVRESMYEAEKEVEEKTLDEMEEAARLAKELRKEKAAGDVKDFTSKFEKLADASVKQEVSAAPKKNSETEEQVEDVVEKTKPTFDTMKPIYSEEELAEIEQEEFEDKEAWDEDVDYEEYDEYYD